MGSETSSWSDTVSPQGAYGTGGGEASMRDTRHMGMKMTVRRNAEAQLADRSSSGCLSLCPVSLRGLTHVDGVGAGLEGGTDSRPLDA